MTFSFARIFLGEKASKIDEDALPCRPRRISPSAVDGPVAVKVKFGLTKIGRTLKHKLRLNTTAPVPAGHGPLTIAVDHKISPFATRMKSPATVGLTPALSSLPHIPEVSSTLGRDIRSATRNALFAAAGEANTKITNSKIFTTPCPQRKRRTVSSSVLGDSGLPHPRPVSYVEILRQQYYELEQPSPEASSSTYNETPANLPIAFSGGSSAYSSPYVDRSAVRHVIAEPNETFAYSSEYNEIVAVVPLGLPAQCEMPSSPPYAGRPANYIVHPVPRRHWCVQQYVEANTEWAMPVMSASDAPTSPTESLSVLSNLEFGDHATRPTSSVYSQFPPVYRAASWPAASEPFSTIRTRNTTYSPIKFDDQARLLPSTPAVSPPATSIVQEAQRRDWYKSQGCELHLTAPLDSPYSDTFTVSPSPLASKSAQDRDVDDIDSSCEDVSGEIIHSKTAIRPVSTSTVLMHNRSKGSYDQRKSSAHRFILRHAPEATLRRGPERYVHITAPGLTRIVRVFDLFPSEENEAIEESASPSESLVSKSADSSRSTSGDSPRQASSKRTSSPVAPGSDYPFTHLAYQNAMCNVPTMGDLMNSRSYSNASPGAKKVAFAKVRHINTLVGEIKEDFEGICNANNHRGQKLCAFVEKVSKLQDLKDGWYQHDEDLIDLEEQIANQSFFASSERQEQDLHREKATKDALVCMQTRLASAKTKLAGVKSHTESTTSDGHDAEVLKLRTHLKEVSEIVAKQGKTIDEAYGTIDDLRNDILELEAELRDTREGLADTF